MVYVTYLSQKSPAFNTESLAYSLARLGVSCDETAVRRPSHNTTINGSRRRTCYFLYAERATPSGARVGTVASSISAANTRIASSDF